jgi:hypothetical protein
MTCMDCINLKTHGESGKRMARQGYGGCAKKPAWEFFSLTMERECDLYRQAPEAVVKERREWAK